MLEATDLERRQTSFVAEALASLPGVSLSQNGAFGGAATIRLRGAAPEQTLVMIDGIVVNDPSNSGGGYNFASLDASSIARIEVLRGPQAVLWGSDAIGGAINIITQRPDDRLNVNGFIERGAFNTTRGAVGLSTSLGAFDARVGASATETDGISKADARDGASETDPFAATSFVAHIGWTINPQTRVEAFSRVSESKNQFDSTGGPTGVRDGDEIGDTRERLIVRSLAMTMNQKPSLPQLSRFVSRALTANSPPRSRISTATVMPRASSAQHCERRWPRARAPTSASLHRCLLG